MISPSNKATLSRSSSNSSIQIGITPNILPEQEVNSLSTKSIEKIIETAEKHLEKLKQPKDPCHSLINIYSPLVTTTDHEVLSDIAFILCTVSTITGITDSTFFTNLGKVKDQLNNIPSAIHQSNEDQKLIYMSNAYIESMEAITPYFDILKSGIDSELKKLKNPLLFEHFNLPIALYKYSYNFWKHTINVLSDQSSSLLEKLATRAKEIHSPSEQSSEVLFFSQGIEINNIQEDNLNFSKHTNEIATFPARVKKAKLEMTTSSNNFKKKFNYLFYLCKYERYPSTWNWTTFKSYYGKSCYNYIDRPDNYIIGTDSPSYSPSYSPSFSPIHSLNSSNSQITREPILESELCEAVPPAFFDREEEFYHQAELIIFGYHPNDEFYLRSGFDSDSTSEIEREERQLTESY
ncbi:MAG: hypothetical protein H0T62_12155 [Parachlamydiaceae bacterium]|nr:hypothetical protein [Parachlamydiaceae bacterium]